ncbi:WD40-repeat-containing domain protein [Kickxella alabastrina]|uniref:WD40-repeat-containing domain protein n=1 Tax=Kickxella alabastrina TaxID=61397 RepID=UPI002220B1E5|nr:WD40-repeat-containing domain protein [Kickxella alabastrina]KAI7827256.1 WD40-repeat-containing domain protein [Kickxella alabastrina]
MSKLQVQPVARKVTAISWLPPRAGTAYTDTDLYFVTGSGAKHKELVLWTTPNPDFAQSEPDSTNDLATVVSKVSHSGDVQGIIALSPGLLATASSTGIISVYNMDTESGSMEFSESVTAHKFSNGEVAGATSLAVQPTGALDVEVASCGEDGRIAFTALSQLKESQGYDVDSTVITDLCWTTPTQLAITTRGGQIKIFDRRMPSEILAAFANSQSSQALESIAVHPSQPFRLATGTAGGSVLVWDIRDMRQPVIEELAVHEANVWQVRFDPADSTRVISCSEDASIAVTQWATEGKGAVALGVAPPERGVRRLSSMFNALSINCFDICPSTRTHLLVAGSDSGNLLMEKTVNPDFKLF